MAPARPSSPGRGIGKAPGGLHGSSRRGNGWQSGRRAAAIGLEPSTGGAGRGPEPHPHTESNAGRAPGRPRRPAPPGVVRRTRRIMSTRCTVVQASVAARRAGPRPSCARRPRRCASVKVMSRTGPLTTGAQVSQEPNYPLWAEQQNAAGGLNVKGNEAADRADRQRRPEQHRDLRAPTRS